MLDREKVVKEYEDYVNSYISLTTSNDYELEMHKAVLALLKEQEAKPVLHERECETLPNHYERKGFCPKCHQVVNWYLNRLYCGFCGQEVKWE